MRKIILTFGLISGAIASFGVRSYRDNVGHGKITFGSEAALQAQTLEMKHYKELYDNPFFNAMMTFAEPFPVGLVISLISAATLRRVSAS